MNQETGFQAVLDLIVMMLLNWRTGSLILLLLAAAAIDIRSHRIPNWLVLAGMLFGVFLNVWLPYSRDTGWLWPLEGIAIGLGAFLPLYLIGAMGAGDVKLMATVGGFVGPAQMLPVLLYTMIAGGVLSILYVLVKGTARRMAWNLLSLFHPGMPNAMQGAGPLRALAPANSAGRMPYGSAIAAGTIAYITAHQLGLT